MGGVFYLILQGKDFLLSRWRHRSPPKRRQVFTKLKALHYYNVHGDHHENCRSCTIYFTFISRM